MDFDDLEHGGIVLVLVFVHELLEVVNQFLLGDLATIPGLLVKPAVDLVVLLGGELGPLDSLLKSVAFAVLLGEILVKLGAHLSDEFVLINLAILVCVQSIELDTNGSEHSSIVLKLVLVHEVYEHPGELSLREVAATLRLAIQPAHQLHLLLLI